jgi:hypothetical protein
MTAMAWIFMLVSITWVVSLLSWCFYKVLTTPPAE